MKPSMFLLALTVGFLGSCAGTGSKPGSALSIEHQDTTTTGPANATPVVDRMGVDSTHQYHRKVTPGELTPLSPEPPKKPAP